MAPMCRWRSRPQHQIRTCAPLHSIEDSASKQRVEPSDRLAATVEVCRLKKRVPKSLQYLAKARAVALEVECHGLCVAGGTRAKVQIRASLDERKGCGESVAHPRDDIHFS